MDQGDLTPSQQAMVQTRDAHGRAEFHDLDLDATIGKHPVTVTATTANGALEGSYTIAVIAKKFPTRRLTVDPNFVDPPADAMARITAEQKEQQAIWAAPAPERLWTGAFIKPVPQPANSRNRATPATATARPSRSPLAIWGSFCGCSTRARARPAASRSTRSLGVIELIGISVSGRLTPLRFDSRPATSTTAWVRSGEVSTTCKRTRPSSIRIVSLTFSAARISGRR